MISGIWIDLFFYIDFHHWSMFNCRKSKTFFCSVDCNEVPKECCPYTTIQGASSAVSDAFMLLCSFFLSCNI